MKKIKPPKNVPIFTKNQKKIQKRDAKILNIFLKNLIGFMMV